MKHLKLFEELHGAGTKPSAKMLVNGTDQITYNVKGKAVVVKKDELHAAVVESLRNGDLFRIYGAELDEQINNISVPIGKAKVVVMVKNFIKKLLADATVQNALADLVASMLTSSNRFRQWTYDSSPLHDYFDIQPVRLAPLAGKIQALFRAVMAQVPGVIRLLITIDEKDCVNKTLLNQRLRKPGVVEDIVTSMINISLQKVMKQKAMTVLGLKDPKKLGTSIDTLDKFV